jgi:hypothetical protein
MFKEERKYNTVTFATKEDLKRETRWLKNDIRDIETMLSDKPSRKHFEDLKSRVDRHLPN